MIIQIVEDVGTIADRLQRLTREALVLHAPEIHVSHSLESARHFLAEHSIDLLMLDLNLHGKDGFGLLEAIVAEPFHTIIVSAFSDKAITAFEYGVLDFVPKPFSKERLTRALFRFVDVFQSAGSDSEGLSKIHGSGQSRFLAVRDNGITHRIPVGSILYLAGAGSYTEIHLENGRRCIHCKSLGALEAILPDAFDRIHKSYVVRSAAIQSVEIVGDHKYDILLQNGERLPASRRWYQLNGS